MNSALTFQLPNDRCASGELEDRSWRPLRLEERRSALKLEFKVSAGPLFGHNNHEGLVNSYWIWYI